MQKVFIRELALDCVIGADAEERDHLQRVVINLEMDCDLTPGIKTDRIEDTCDYRAINRRLLAALKDSQFYLIERMAEVVADICLEFPRVQRVIVTVDKPGALSCTQSAAVQLAKDRDGQL